MTTTTQSFTVTIHGGLISKGTRPAPGCYCIETWSLDLPPCQSMSAAHNAAEEAITSRNFDYPTHAAGFIPERVLVRSETGTLFFAADVEGKAIHWIHDFDDLDLWNHHYEFDVSASCSCPCIEN